MKKIIIFTITFLTMFMVTNFQAVSADTHDDWAITLQNTTASYYVALFEVDILYATETITFEIPPSSRHTLYNGSDRPTFTLIDKDGNTIHTDRLDLEYDNQIDGTFTMNFNILGFSNAEVRGLIVSIPQDFGSPPSGYFTYLDDYPVTITQSYDDGLKHHFIKNETASWTRLEMENIRLDYDTYVIELILGTIPYYVVDDVYSSFVTLKYENTNVADTLFLKDYMNFNKSSIYLEIPYDPLEYVVNDIKTFDVYLYISDQVTHEEIINYSLQFDYTFNGIADFRNVTFISQGIELNTISVLVGSTFAFPNSPTPPSGFQFDGWYTIDGEKALNIITENDGDAKTFYYYARFKYVTVEVDGTTVTPVENTNGIFGSLTTMLSGFGYDTATGQILIYGVTMLVAIGFMIFKRFPMFLVGLVALALHVVFHIWGIIDGLTVVIGYFLTGFVIFTNIVIKSDNGGVANE